MSAVLKYFKYIFIFSFLINSGKLAYAQEIISDTTIISDTSTVIAPEIQNNSTNSIIADTTVGGPQKRQYSPKKATILSTMLPGAGQFYNRKYWKIPIIYGLGGLLVYFAYDNNDFYKAFGQAFKDTTLVKKTLDTLKTDALKAQWMISEYPKYSLNNRIYRDRDLKRGPDQLLRWRDNYLRNKQLNIITMVGLYLLNILDAHVDAHLKNFDVDENLSLNIEPVPNFNINEPPSFVLSLTYKLK